MAHARDYTELGIRIDEDGLTGEAFYIHHTEVNGLPVQVHYSEPVGLGPNDLFSPEAFLEGASAIDANYPFILDP